MKQNYLKNINGFIGCSVKCDVNDTIIGLNNFDKQHQYLQGINRYCILNDCLANLNCSSTILTALIAIF